MALSDEDYKQEVLDILIGIEYHLKSISHMLMKQQLEQKPKQNYITKATEPRHAAYLEEDDIKDYT